MSSVPRRALRGDFGVGGYDEQQFVRLARQDQLKRVGLKYRVDVTAEANC